MVRWRAGTARTSAGVVFAAAWLAVAACEEGRRARPSDGAEEPAGAVIVIDDAGREIRLPRPAQRIVSLVPSVTETIVVLGAADRLVARTRYDLDAALADLPSLGGGLDPSVEAIVDLAPDLVVAWNARDDRILGPRLRAAGIPVYSAEIQDTTAIFSTFDRIGRLTGRRAAADSLAAALRDSLRAVAADVPPGHRPTAIYLIVGDPPRVAGAMTFIGQALAVAGADPAFPDLAEPWPTVSLESVVARDPELVVLPIGEELVGREDLERRPGWRDLPAVRAGRVVEVEADLLARPGPALGRAARELRRGLSTIREENR